MAIASQVVGIPSLAVTGIIGVSADYEAAGTNQATATPIGVTNNRISAVSSGQGVRLAKVSRGDAMFVLNDTATALLVYPPEGEGFEGLSVNAATTVAAGAYVEFKKFSIDTWARGADAAGMSFVQSGIGVGTPVARSMQDKGREIRTTADFTGSGDMLVGLGPDVLLVNTTGEQNTAIGDSAMKENTTGLQNTAVGSQALRTNTTGRDNVALGTSASLLATDAINNVAVGRAAMLANVSGDDNVAIGRDAMVAATAPFRNTAVGSEAQFDLIDGTDNTSIGYRAHGNATDGDHNTAVGGEAGFTQTTALRTTFVGYRAGFLNTANDTVAVGRLALSNNAAGVRNTAVGTDALEANTSGGDNTAVGWNALQASETVSDSTALGSQALLLATGQRNTAVGSNCLLNISTGTENIAMGYNAGNGITTGGGNTILGAKLNGLATGLTNNIILGAGGTARLSYNGTNWTTAYGLTSSNATAGIGYATGAGGTQTQGTSKSTTVVLNTITGEITMHNATLNADTTVSFTLTNSAIASGDYVVVQHVSAGTAAAYNCTALAGSGSATINVRNVTPGNLGEAIVLKFVVIKAATS